MAKCSKCGKEIAELTNTQIGEQVWRFSIDKEGDPDYERDGFHPDNQGDKYECPECGKTLFTSEEEAIKFLKG